MSTSKSHIHLTQLYPIGIDAEKATPEARERFERWKDSPNFACLNEEDARRSFPLLFLDQGEQSPYEAIFGREIIPECTEAFEREYPLKDGSLVVKRVAWIKLINGGNPEFGDSYPERMYFFREPANNYSGK